MLSTNDTKPRLIILITDANGSVQRNRFSPHDRYRYQLTGSYRQRYRLCAIGHGETSLIREARLRWLGQVERLKEML